jgi:hypothetical protein
MHKQHLSSENRFYIAYRKIRFLAKTGSLFSFSKPIGNRKTEISRGTFQTISINSLLLFLMAYLIIYTLNLFITAYTAILFNIPVLVYYHDVDYLIRGIDWTPDSVSGVFSSGPIAMFVLSLFLLILYKAVETETGILRLLLLWMIFHALTRFFGEILVGAILNKGFGFVILYMFVMDTGKVILTILGFGAMFTVGLMMARMSLYSANIYFNDLLSNYRNKFIFSQFILPFFIGNIVILLIKLPKFSYFDIALNASMILFLIPVYVRSKSVEDFYFDQDPRTIKLKMLLPVTTILLFLLFRLILGFGIRL